MLRPLRVASRTACNSLMPTIIIAATLVLLFELQCPFQSDLRIPPTDWNGVIGCATKIASSKRECRSV